MVTSNGGQVHREEDWGRRILAYMINDLHKAHYVLLNIECDSSTLREIEGHFRFNDSILRHLIIRRKEAIVEQSPILKAKIKEDEAEKLSRERKMREELENQGDQDAEESADVETDDQSTETVAAGQDADGGTEETAAEESVDADVEEPVAEEAESKTDETEPEAEEDAEEASVSESDEAEVQEQNEEEEAK